ncbi:unnamed protein product [Arctogadus glacialis]
MREKRREKEEGKRSGSAARTGKKWKFFAVLSFLDPFVTPRETSSILPRWAEIEVEIEDDGAAETSGVEEADEERDEAAATGPSHNTDQLSGNESDPDDVPAAAAATTPAPAAGPAPRPQSGM